MRPLRLWLAWALLGAVLAPTAASAAARYVVIAVVDGPRASEFLDEPGRPHVPVLDSVLIPQGAYIPSFRAEGVTKTLPGHSAILTGTAQPIANDGSQRPDQPTLFERLRKEKGLPVDAAWMVGGKDKFTAVTYSTHPDYGAAYGASLDTQLRDDLATFAAAIQVLSRPTPPVFTCINFASTDLEGHSGVWSNYLAAISRADSLLGELWSFIQADTALAGKTDLFITADHGRHLDAFGGFQNHGDGCEGCRVLPFVALGPDLKSGYVSAETHRQEDLGATVRYLLGLTAGPPPEGFVIADILVNFTQSGVEPTLPAGATLRAAPNPFSRSTRISVAGWAPSLLEVFAFNGRRVVSLPFDPALGTTWEGRGEGLRGSPAGVYWIRLSDPDGRKKSIRVVHVP